MAKARITKRVVDALQPGDSPIWDTEIKGFGVRAAGEAKTYVVVYRPQPGGRTAPKRWFTIGQHGSPWTPENARKKAKSIIGKVEDGEDPALEKRQARMKDGKTIEELVPEFVKGLKRLRSSHEIERVLTREIVPTLGSKRPIDVARHEVAVILHEIADRAPIMANRVRTYTGQFFKWCVERGNAESNPCAKITLRGKPVERDRVLSDEELAEVWRAAEAEGEPWASLVKLLSLTAQRRNEVAAMEWDELDLKEKVWTIPAARTKNKREHKVSLCETALAIIASAKQIKNCPYVFTTNGKTPISGFSKVKARIDARIIAARQNRDKKAKAPPRWTFHDLRRTAITGMARLGIAPHIADAVLNHKEGTIRGVAAVYNRHAYYEERQRALEAWEKLLLSIVEGKPQGSNIVPIAKSA